jgi:hypothetical protein
VSDVSNIKQSGKQVGCSGAGQVGNHQPRQQAILATLSLITGGSTNSEQSHDSHTYLEVAEQDGDLGAGHHQHDHHQEQEPEDVVDLRNNSGRSKGKWTLD